MKKLLILIALTQSVFAEMTPNLPHNTPVSYTNADLVVAMTILGEARGEGQIGMKLVADVIYTRMEKRKLSAYEVVTQPNQFLGVTYNNMKDKNLPFALVLALALKDNIDIYPEYEFDQFRALRSPIPSWAINARVYKGHVFFKEEK